ncbi:hypothetical protein, partial [Mycobacterium tuberculosis]|uniref:hypothetical protein n=1 Tax=Mycobacterium tuberculosis TaxID=1773 RepID=UPI001AE3A308
MPQTAREEAAEILRQRRRGVDPFEERKRNRVAEEAARRRATLDAEQARRFQFAAFSEEFIEEYAKKNQPRSWENTQRALLD